MHIHFLQQSFGNKDGIPFTDLPDVKVAAEVGEMPVFPGTQESKVHFHGGVIGVLSGRDLGSSVSTSLDPHLRRFPYSGRECNHLAGRRGSESTHSLGDPVLAKALLDRPLHQAIVMHIEGASYWLRQHADVFPEAMHQNGLAHALATAIPIAAAHCGRGL